jgi:hypothetical protein
LRRPGQGCLDAFQVPRPIAKTEHQGASESNSQGDDDKRDEQPGLKQRVHLSFFWLIHARCFPFMIVFFIGAVMALFVEREDEIAELPQGFSKMSDLDAIYRWYLIQDW